MKKDNSTLALKVSLRRNLLDALPEPVVMETHGGYGAVWRRCYADLTAGVVFEKDPEKAGRLGRQRPGWAVYECDCEHALAAGVGFHLPVNFLDVDPYGEPWPVLDAFFGVERDWPARLALAVNDGLRQKLRINGGWDVGSMQPVVAKYGARAMDKNYLEICRELVEEKAGQRGYALVGWTAYFCGSGGNMTHYGAILERS